MGCKHYTEDCKCEELGCKGCYHNRKVTTDEIETLFNTINKKLESKRFKLYERSGTEVFNIIYNYLKEKEQEFLKNK